MVRICSKNFCPSLVSAFSCVNKNLLGPNKTPFCTNNKNWIYIFGLKQMLILKLENSKQNTSPISKTIKKTISFFCQAEIKNSLFKFFIFSWKNKSTRRKICFMERAQLGFFGNFLQCQAFCPVFCFIDWTEMPFAGKHTQVHCLRGTELMSEFCVDIVRLLICEAQ